MLTGVGMDVMRDLSGAATGALISAVWQGTLLAGAAALGLRMLPKTPPAVRFAIWFSVFLVLAALPVGGVLGHGGVGSVAPVAGGTTRAAWLTFDDRWSEGVLLLWAAVSVSRLGMLIAGAVRVRALWKRATPVEIAGLEPGEGSAFGRQIEICTSDEVDRPSVIGFFAPRILIPRWLVQKLTPQEMAHVVLHETGHLRRADDWLNLLQKIGLVLFPLNPALAWVERRLCFERELACDERVLKATGASKAYASCLTSLAEHRMTRKGMALVMGALGRESELGQRVRRILARGEHMAPAHARLVMGGAVCALLAGAAGLEQCPRLVGFSDAREVAAKAPAAALPRYQDVVYRAGGSRSIGNGSIGNGSVQMRAVNTVLRQPVVSEGVSLAKTRAIPQNGFGAAPVNDVRRGARMQQVGLRRKLAGGQPFASEWVVMTSVMDSPGITSSVVTSWTATSADGGARIVMTSVAAGPSAQPSPEAWERVSEEAREAVATVPARAIPAMRQVVPVRQISPYAAVPVRGGWLVFQL